MITLGRVTPPGRWLYRALVAAWGVTLAGVATADGTPATTPPLQLEIVAPSTARVAVGPTRFAVHVDVPEGRRVVEVRLYVDGKPLAMLSSPPYEAMFDAGTALRAHTLRAEAEDDLGHTAADFATTLYLSYVEEVDVKAAAVPRHAIQVGVIDRRRQPIPDLDPQQFILRVDHRIEPLLSAERDRRPLAVEILLDVSGSTLAFLPQIREAADRFVSSLDPGDGSEVSVFAGSTVRLAPFSHDHEQTRRRLRTIRFELEIPDLEMYGSHLYDALAHAVEAINVQPGQRSIVVFTDTFDTGSDLPYEQVAGVIRRANIRVDLIRFGQRSTGALADTRLIKQMRRLAAETGGREWRIRYPEDILATFDLLRRQLTGRYRLVFAPDRAGAGAGYRRLKVSVARKGARVLAPAGFYEEASRLPPREEPR